MNCQILFVTVNCKRQKQEGCPNGGNYCVSRDNPGIDDPDTTHAKGSRVRVRSSFFGVKSVGVSSSQLDFHQQSRFEMSESSFSCPQHVLILC